MATGRANGPPVNAKGATGLCPHGPARHSPLLTKVRPAVPKNSHSVNGRGCSRVMCLHGPATMHTGPVGTLSAGRGPQGHRRTGQRRGTIVYAFVCGGGSHINARCHVGEPAGAVEGDQTTQATPA